MPPRKRLPITRSAPSRSSLEERQQGGEVVGVVGVAHHHVRAASGTDAAHQGVAVSLVGHRHDAGARIAGELLAAIGAAVVGDDDLAVDAVLLEEADGLAHTGLYGLSLVQARHHHGEFHVVSSITPLPVLWGFRLTSSLFRRVACVTHDARRAATACCKVATFGSA